MSLCTVSRSSSGGAVLCCPVLVRIAALAKAWKIQNPSDEETESWYSSGHHASPVCKVYILDDVVDNIWVVLDGAILAMLFV